MGMPWSAMYATFFLLLLSCISASEVRFYSRFADLHPPVVLPDVEVPTGRKVKVEKYLQVFQFISIPLPTDSPQFAKQEIVARMLAGSDIFQRLVRNDEILQQALLKTCFEKLIFNPVETHLPLDPRELKLLRTLVTLLEILPNNFISPVYLPLLLLSPTELVNRIETLNFAVDRSILRCWARSISAFSLSARQEVLILNTLRSYSYIKEACLFGAQLWKSRHLPALGDTWSLFFGSCFAYPEFKTSIINNFLHPDGSTHKRNVTQLSMLLGRVDFESILRRVIDGRRYALLRTCANYMLNYGISVDPQMRREFEHLLQEVNLLLPNEE